MFENLRFTTFMTPLKNSVRIPPVLLKLEEEREEEEEDETDEDETLGWRRTDIPYVRLRFEYNSLRNVKRK